MIVLFQSIIMKLLIAIIISFIIGVVAGSYWWIQQTQTKLIELSTELYESWLQSAATSGTVSNEISTAAQAQIDLQIAKYKAQAQQQASNYLQSQINEFFQ